MRKKWQKYALAGCLAGMFLLIHGTVRTFEEQNEEEYVSPTGRTKAFPKILHHIWMQGHTIPPPWSYRTNSCKRMYSSYQQYIWSKEDIDKFISQHYPHLLSTYQNYKYDVQRTDCARYLILHHFGGMYLDADIRCLITIEPYMENLTHHSPQKEFVTTESWPRSAGNGMIIAKPGSVFLHYIIRHIAQYASINYILNYPTVMYSTGPGFLGTMYYSYHSPDEVQLVSEELGRHFSHGSYASWQSWDGKLINKIHYRWKWWTATLLGLIIVIYLLCKFRARATTRTSKITQC